MSTEEDVLGFVFFWVVPPLSWWYQSDCWLHMSLFLVSCVYIGTWKMQIRSHYWWGSYRIVPVYYKTYRTLNPHWVILRHMYYWPFIIKALGKWRYWPIPSVSNQENNEQICDIFISKEQYKFWPTCDSFQTRNLLKYFQVYKSQLPTKSWSSPFPPLWLSFPRRWLLVLMLRS